MEYLAGPGQFHGRSAQQARSPRALIVAAMIVVLLGGVVLALAGIPAARAADATLPIDKVQPGMVGYAKTVATGTVVTTFTVEVIGVLTNDPGFPEGNYIVFRASGDLINQTQGIVAGMSGSPIYLQDPDDSQYKIAGAISYGDAFVDPKIAFATGIDDMLELTSAPGMATLAMRPTRLVPRDGTAINAGGGRIIRSAVVDDGTGRVPPDTLSLKPLGGLISVSGLSPSSRGYARIKTKLESKGFRVIPAVASGRAGPDVSTATIEPGASLGVGLTSGDATIAGIGTVTYVDDTKVLGFGHPMLWIGTANFPMMTGYVHTIWPSDSGFGYKIASAGDTTGTIVQDRSMGVAGRLGQTPLETPLSVDVVNATEGTSTSRSYRISKGAMNVSELGPDLAWDLAAATSDVAFEDVAGTAETSFTIAGTTATGKSFSLGWGNRVYNKGWIGGVAPDDFAMSLYALLENDFEDVTITAMSYGATVTAQRQTARLVDASLLGRRIVAGSTMTVRLSYVPYNSDTTQTVDTTIAIPAGFPATAMLSASCADDYDEEMALMNQTRNFTQIVEAIENRQRDDEINVTLIPGSSDMYGLYAMGAMRAAAVPITKTLRMESVMSGSVMKNTASITMAGPSAVTYGGAARFTGRVSDLSDPYHFDVLDERPKVELWMKPYGSAEGTIVATTLGSQTTGAYAISYVPTITGTFWTRFAGNDSLLDAKSSSRVVNVRAYVSIRSSAYRTRLGRTVTLSGGVRPVFPGRTAEIQILSGRRWYRLALRPLGATGDYSYRWTLRRRGVFRLRARFFSFQGYASNYSRTIAVVVY